MVSLATAGLKFHLHVKVIEGGTGIISGSITEPDQNQVPSYIFIAPRHVLRTAGKTALRAGMVVQTPEGKKYIVGNNGPSEQTGGTIFQSFRLFEVTRLARWERRTKETDAVTHLPRDTGKTDMGLIHIAFEPTDREVFDRKIRASLEQARFLAGKPVMADDILDGKTVIRSDLELGIKIGILS